MTWSTSWVFPRVWVLAKVASKGILTHWVASILCLRKLTIIGSDNDLSSGRRQAIIWTSVGILSIRPWVTYFNEILFGIRKFSFKKMPLKISSAKWRPFCLSLNVLTYEINSGHRSCCNVWYLPEMHHNSNLAKYRSSIAFISFAQSSWCWLCILQYVHAFAYTVGLILNYRTMFCTCKAGNGFRLSNNRVKIQWSPRAMNEHYSGIADKSINCIWIPPLKT